ncbi:hypothetical protein C8J56DRAFT_1027408 [Mycena floridula]|nr:hypothetical protein C8J56DRAFT_1027408 [Mycena floridula]
MQWIWCDDSEDKKPDLLEGNELFREGCFGRAEEMYIVSQKLFPPLLVLANLAAIALKKREWNPFWRLLSKPKCFFDAILNPRQNKIMLYAMILADIKAARKITPNSPDLAIESNFIEKLRAYEEPDDLRQILEARQAGHRAESLRNSRIGQRASQGARDEIYIQLRLQGGRTSGVDGLVCS